MGTRRSMSNSKRFEIFKRDGFRCLYCGGTPVQVLLRVDHVIPVAKGGTDDPSNLVTSCFDCNAGKAARPLGERRFESKLGREEDKEHAQQILEYLKVQREITAAKDEVVDELERRWLHEVGELPTGMRSRLRSAVQEFGLQRAQEAIEIVARNLHGRGPTAQVKYLHGIFRKWREEEQPVSIASPAPVLHRSRRALEVEQALRNLVVPGGRTIQDIVERFQLLAFTDEKDLFDFSADYPLTCRGLLLEVKPATEPNTWMWTVLDEPGWRLEDDLHNVIHVPVMVLGYDLSVVSERAKSGQVPLLAEIESARDSLQTIGAKIYEADAFRATLRGEPGSREELLKRRKELGLPNPPE